MARGAVGSAGHIDHESVTDVVPREALEGVVDRVRPHHLDVRVRLPSIRSMPS
jgi:hypothetical protein